MAKQNRFRGIHAASILNGFAYHVKDTGAATRYLECYNMKKKGCSARAILRKNQDLRITRGHNHPPDLNAKEKSLFLQHLRKNVNKMDTLLKNFYDLLVYYPKTKPQKAAKNIRTNSYKVIHKGFVYHLRIVKKNIRYLRCAKEKHTGCLASAKLRPGKTAEDLELIRSHNHPPDDTIAVRVKFENLLKETAKSMPDAFSKDIYNVVAEMCPEDAKMFPFSHKYYTNIKRWKKIKS